MTRVATKPKTEPKVEPKTQDSTAKFGADLAQTADSMLKGCSKLRIRKSAGFSTTARIDDATANAMLKKSVPVAPTPGTTSSEPQGDVETDDVTLYKKLFKIKDPEIKEPLRALGEAKKAISEHVNAWTVPLIAIQSVKTEASQPGDLRKEGGVRIIEKHRMQEFDDRFNYLVGLLTEAAAAVDAAMPKIMEAEKVRLKHLFRESDYPTDLANAVRCHISYEPIGVDIDWEKTCPEIYRREAASARVRFEHVVESAAVEWSKNFVKYVEQVVNQLGHRQRINPAAGEFSKYADAEILETVTHDYDDEVPVGHVKVQIRLKRAEGQTGKSQEIWLDPMTETRFRDVLRPYESGKERRTIFASTVSNLKSEMDKFLNIGPLLGPYQALVSDAVTKVKDMLGRGDRDMDPDNIARKLKQGDYFRDEMKKVLVGVSTLVKDGISEGVEKRRTVSRRLIGMNND